MGATPEGSLESIFSNANVPPPISFREGQQQQTRDFCRQAILYPSSSRAVYIHGPSGSGKSHCINSLKSHLMDLKPQFKTHNYPLHIVSIDFCYDLVQPNDIYGKILESQCDTREQFDQFLKRENKKKMRIIIAENLDRCVDNNWQDLLVEICCLTTTMNFLLVGLGREMLNAEFTEDHHIDVIAFPPYEPKELTEILQQTVQENDMIFQTNALHLLEEKVELNHGYLRALEPICALAIEKAKGQKKDQVELVHMESAFNAIDFVLKNISQKAKSTPSKLLYKAVVTVLYGRYPHVASLNDLHRTYQRICREANENRSYNQIRAMCSRFQSNGGLRVKNHQVEADHLVLETISAGVQGQFM